MPASRSTLLQAYDACHERQGWRQVQERWNSLWSGRWSEHSPVCTLQLIWPDETLTKAVRLAATVDIYRGLTGDMTTPDQALADHALLVAKKRDFAHNTPSAGFRRWLAEPPFPDGYPRASLGAIGYEYAITPDDDSSWVWSLRNSPGKRSPGPPGPAPDANGATTYIGDGPPPPPPRAMPTVAAPPPSPPLLNPRPPGNAADYGAAVAYQEYQTNPQYLQAAGSPVGSPVGRRMPRSRTPPPQKSAVSAFDAAYDGRGPTPGPADYDQSSGTIANSIFDKSVSQLPAGFAKQMRKSASFASRTARTSQVVDGRISGGPRKGPAGGILKHNYFYDQPPPSRASRPSPSAAAAGGSDFLNGSGTQHRKYPGVDLQRVASVFSKFGDGRFIQCKDLWGALHHYGVETTSKYAHRVVHAYDKHPEGQLEMQDFAVIIRQIEAPTEERERRETEAAAARSAAMERAEARALTEEREKQEAAAEWARSAALESARAKAEEARVRRARFEAKAAEERVWAEAKAAEEQAMREAEVHEYEYRRKAQEEAEVAEAWRVEQRQAEMQGAWGEAWADADLRREYREKFGEAEQRAMDYDARGNAMQAMHAANGRVHEEARQRLSGQGFGAGATLTSPTLREPARTPQYFPTTVMHPNTPPPQMPAGGYAPAPAHPVSQPGAPSPEHRARLLAAETAAAEAMAALARVQREVHGAAAVQASARW